MVSYSQSRKLLDDFFAKYDEDIIDKFIDALVFDNEISACDMVIKSYASTVFYRDIDIHQDKIDIYILCKISYGKGDLVNSIKTYNILKNKFANTKLLVLSGEYHQIMAAIKILYPNCNFPIELFDHTYIDRGFYARADSIKVFIACALPVYFERFDAIPGPKRYIFFDEYNGWRIKIPDINGNIHKNGAKIENNCTAVHPENDKINCTVCRENEYYQSYEIDGCIPDNLGVPNPDHEWMVATGIGMVEDKIPAQGVHIMDEPIIDITNSTINDFIAKANGDYHFAYLSMIEGQNHSFKYLQIFMDSIKLYRHNINCNKLTYFIVLDSEKYMYREKNDILFKNGDVIEMFDNMCIVTNHVYKRCVLYLKKLRHNDMLYLMKNSHPYIFLSGDQSLVEGISLHRQSKTKVIFYQVQAWKTNLIQEFYKIGHKILPPGSNLEQLQFMIFGNSYYCNYYSIAKLLENPEILIRESAQVYDYIIENFNLANTIPMIIKRAVYETKDIANITSKMVDKYIKSKDYRKEYQAFAKELGIKKPRRKRKCIFTKKRVKRAAKATK